MIMRYYTTLMLTANNVSLEEISEIKEFLTKHNYENTRIGGFLYLGYGKHYEEQYVPVFRSLSKKYPNAAFNLMGYGTEVGDIWNMWFKDGKSSESTPAKIVFQEFFDAILK